MVWSASAGGAFGHTTYLLFSLIDVDLLILFITSYFPSLMCQRYIEVNQNASVSSPKWHEALVIFETRLGIFSCGGLRSPVTFEALFSCGRGG